MSRKVYNFNAGPAQLPEPVLLKAQSELLDWRGTGISILELGHRSDEFRQIREQCEADFRELLSIPDSYDVLFYTSGATLHMSLIPMNLLAANTCADYITTGYWSKKASQIAADFCQVYHCPPEYDPETMNLPDLRQITVSDNSAYLYYCDNETIEGVEFNEVPLADAPLVCDMTSNILSRPMNVLSFGCIFAGFQKNIGPAGMTVLIIEKQLLERAVSLKPDLMNYQYVSAQHGVPNTPAVFQWYMAGLMFQWLKEQGGIIAMDNHAKEKSALLYDLIDASDLYENSVVKNARSRLNVPFRLMDETLKPIFIQETRDAKLFGLEGHRSRGGFRASLYNAVSLESVQILCEFMTDFEKRQG